MPLRVLDLCEGMKGWGAAFRERGHDVVGIEIEAKLSPTLQGDVRHFAGRAQALLSALIEPGWKPDVVVASPPCEGFSIASVSRSWEPLQDGSFKPKSDTARTGLEVLNACLDIIAELQPDYWWLENPRAMMRRMPQLRGHRHAEVSQCAYGNIAAKATDLWGRWPSTWKPRPFCKTEASGGVVDAAGRTYRVEQVGTGKTKTFKLHGHGEAVPVPRDGRPIIDGKTLPLRVVRPDGKPCHEWSARGFKTGTQGISGANARAVIPYELSLDVCKAVEASLRPVLATVPARPTRSIEATPARKWF